MRRILEGMQNVMLGYCRTSPKRHFLFYVSMFVSLLSFCVYIFENYNSLMDFHVLVAAIGMALGVGIIFLFDINSLLSIGFFILISILPRFVFSYVNSLFIDSPFENIAYVLSSLFFLLFEFFGFVLTADVYDPDSCSSCETED